MKKSLPDILKEAAQIAAEIESQGGELEDWLATWKAQNYAEKEEKIENYAKYVERLEMEIEHAHKKSKAWADRKFVLTNRLSKFKDWIKYLLNCGESLKTDNVKFNLRKSERLVIEDGFDFNLLDKKYLKITHSINKALLKKEYDKIDEHLKSAIRIEEHKTVQMKGGE